MSMSLTQTIIIVLGILVLFLLITIKSIISNELVKKRKLEELKFFNLILPNMGDIDATLDQFITGLIAEFFALHPNYINIKDYSNEMQEDIQRYITELFEQRVSQGLLNQLSLIYNSDSISDIIDTRIKLAVISATMPDSILK